MKKFWNLMLVALVMLGAAACTKSDTSIEKENNEEAGLSFYAEITNDSTRADLEYDEVNKVWNTVWEGNETIVVSLGETSFEFTNDTTEPSKFTCTAQGVSSLLGQSVTIAIANPEQSKVGKSGVVASAAVEAFDNTKTIKLEATNSYLRYTYNGEGKVELSLTYEGGKAFVYNEGQAFDTVAIEGVKGENFVSFNAPAEKTEAQLAYSINGVECKSKAINVVAGKVYNLGELTMPYETSAYSVVGTHNNWSAGQTPMYIIGDYAVAYGVVFAGTENKFKVLGNDKWLGSNSFALNTWTSLATGTDDMTIVAGTYDIYFSEAECKVCVVAVGAEVPAMPVFSIGLAGLGGNWDVDKDMTLEGDYYTLKSVAIAATDTFKLRISDSWAENYGIASDTSDEQVAINYDAMYTLVQDGTNMQVAAGTYDIYFNYETKEFYVLTEGTTPEELSIPQYKVYVYNYGTNWSNIYLYMWDDNETFIFGAWPGATTTTKETINGYEYLVWTMPKSATGKKVNAILNNNSGAQTADYSLGTIDSDKYILLNSGVADEIKDINNPEPEIPATTHKIYVYKHNNTWTTLNLYSWDATTEAKYTGGWPGSKTTVTEVINGYTYYVWEMPAAATNRQIRMIFNNGSAQTGDSDPYTLDKDLYIRLNGAAIQDIDDPNNPEPTVVAQPRKIYATTTLSWTKMNIYAWGGGASLSWPGAQMSTETINGTKYYVYTFDASFDGVTLSGVIFNNGSAQTVDITNVKLDQDRFFRVLTTQTSGKYKYEAIADPR